MAELELDMRQSDYQVDFSIRHPRGQNSPNLPRASFEGDSRMRTVTRPKHLAILIWMSNRDSRN